MIAQGGAAGARARRARARRGRAHRSKDAARASRQGAREGAAVTSATTADMVDVGKQAVAERAVARGHVHLARATRGRGLPGPCTLPSGRFPPSRCRDTVAYTIDGLDLSGCQHYAREHLDGDARLQVGRLRANPEVLRRMPRSRPGPLEPGATGSGARVRARRQWHGGLSGREQRRPRGLRGGLEDEARALAARQATFRGRRRLGGIVGGRGEWWFGDPIDYDATAHPRTDKLQ